MEGDGEYTGLQCQEVGTNLGGTIQSYRHCRRESILLGGLGQKASPPAMECLQSQEILPLIITECLSMNVRLCISIAN